MAGDIVVTDLTIGFLSPIDPAATCPLDVSRWHRIEKDLCLHSLRQSAWLQVAQTEEKDLTLDDLIVTDIRISEEHPETGSESSWESRPGGIWVLRSSYSGGNHQAVTGVDALFGTDAVDSRP